MDIDIDNPKKVEALLDAYRSEDPEEYNNVDWLEFLLRKEIRAEILEVDHQIYF